MNYLQDGLNNFESDENLILFFYCWAQRHAYYENLAKYLCVRNATTSLLLCFTEAVVVPDT